MGDIGVHVVDRIRWLIGEFESVWGHADTFIPELPDRTDGVSPGGDGGRQASLSSAA